jgi:predicted Zn-dependent protease
MIARRIALPILALLVSAVAPGNRTRALAPMLPEIQKHLDSAESCITKGQPLEAVAHCDVVLVSQEITVGWDTTMVPNGLKGVCERAVYQATEAWAESLDNQVHFKLVDESKDAQVVVVFRPDVLLKGEAVAGLLNWKRIISTEEGSPVAGKFTSEMLVRVTMPDGRSMPNDAIRHTVTHEMGHVFGLEDTDRIGELMGPLNLSHPLNRPEPHEIAAVLAVRAQAQQIKTRAEQLIVQ